MKITIFILVILMSLMKIRLIILLKSSVMEVKIRASLQRATYLDFSSRMYCSTISNVNFVNESESENKDSLDDFFFLLVILISPGCSPADSASELSEASLESSGGGGWCLLNFSLLRLFKKKWGLKTLGEVEKTII